MDWREKKIPGDQFISAVDSIGANIAEGFGRFHYLDRNKCNYNARGSLIESSHWIGILFERELIKKEAHESFSSKLRQLTVKLNNYIKATKSLKK